MRGIVGELVWWLRVEQNGSILDESHEVSFKLVFWVKMKY